MPLYHTSRFSGDAPGAVFSSRGAAWSFEKESGIGPRATQGLLYSITPEEKLTYHAGNPNKHPRV
jgi:hypothetical protein